jgi:hypothetical protein
MSNTQILLMSLFNEKLPNFVVKGDLIVIDRGYDTALDWLLRSGFNLLHTKQRSKNFIFTFGLKSGSKPGKRIEVQEKGEMGAYWATQVKKVRLADDSTDRTVTLTALAYRSGTGRVVLMLTTN